LEPLVTSSFNANLGELFPTVPRVFYRKAPLFQVTCQIKFPAILKIQSEPPAALQDRIRDAFPLFEGVATQIIPNIPESAANIVFNQLISTGYQFHTEDKDTTISLSTDSIAITTKNYKEWRIFRDQFIAPLSAFVELYKPVFFTRIGLRYQDLVVREKLGFDKIPPWSKLLRKEILGELCIADFEDNMIDCRRVLYVKIPSIDANLLLQHGMAKLPGNQTPGYLFDFDFSSSKKIGVDDAGRVLVDLHNGSGRAFRWCITDLLHDALDPVPFDDDALGS
jgi:uncharacterized protein (TIGR04255 family)